MKNFTWNSAFLFEGRSCLIVITYCCIKNVELILELKELILWIKITTYLPFSDRVLNDHVIIW